MKRIHLRRTLISAAILGSVAVMPGLGAAPIAAASTSPNWVTPFVIQNIDTVAASDVQVGFYDTNGNLTHTLDLGGLGSGASVPVRPQNALPDGYTLPAGQYSVVISSDAKISAIANETAGFMAASYAGAQSWKLTGTSVSFPNVLRNYAGWNSPVTVQNAGAQPTTVTITFNGFNTGQQAAQVTSGTLQPGQAYTVDPATVSGLTDNTQYGVVATSNMGQPLVGEATQDYSNSLMAMSYTGSSSPASLTTGNTVYLPNVLRNYVGYNSPFIVQNVGSQATNVTAYYYRFADGQLMGQDGPYNLGAGLSHPFRPAQTPFLTDNTQYAVKVVSDSAPVSALVNETSATTSMSYSGLSTGSTTIDAPNITDNYYGWNTPIVVQNVSGTTANVTATYYNFATGQAVKSDGPYAVGASLSHPFRPWQTSGLPSGQYSVVVTSDQPVVAVVNETNSASDSMSYEGQSP